MDKNKEIWQQFYEKSLTRKHLPRTEFAVKINKSNFKTAIDCGCGTGSDISYLIKLDYLVHGFDVNSDSLAICRDRFGAEQLVKLSEASFESFDYPACGLIIANSSLYFAERSSFENTWRSLTLSLVNGGVFAGDFMGVHDSWALGSHRSTTPLTRQQVLDLFVGFEVIRFHERNEVGKTALGKTKHWHTFSVVALKLR